MPSHPIEVIVRTLTLAFLAILFLQSGIDKIVDRRGNLEWLTGHFAKSPLAKTVPLLLGLITLLELGAGACSAIGCILVLTTRDTRMGLLGAALSGTAILALFFGQRMAKDYAGAAVLVPYFLVTILALLFLA
jgi:hypothetical protein